jgi:hypothetical protein
MIETYVLFHDTRNQELGQPERKIWARFTFDIADLIGVSEFVDQELGEIDKEVVQIDIRGGLGSLTIRMRYDAIKNIWQEYKKRKICLN